MNSRESDLFEKMPVTRAVMRMVIPTVISQLIIVLYNMADTFFIGQTGDPNQVAAANICMPIFFFLNGFSNLFGIGGSSLISRSLGRGENEKAKKASAFSIWGGITVSLCYGILIYVFRGTLLPVFGANDGTFGFCGQYMFWTLLIGSVPTVMNALLAHLVRAEGYSRQASFGMIMGAVLNIILDPIFISVFGMEIAGAALATMISNVAAVCYFIIFILKRRGKTTVMLSPKYLSFSGGIPKEILLTGLPSTLMSVMSTASNIMVNRLLSAYCNEAIAGVGIAKKIDMLAFGIATGMSQGVVPLVGYNYSSGNYSRMKKAIKTTFILSLTVASVCAVLLFTCARPLVSAFIDNPLTVKYGQKFQRIICIPGPCISVTLIIITVFQSAGKKIQPLLLSLLRKGGLDIPFMILFDVLFGIDGIIWATPIADFSAMIIAILTLIPFWKRLESEEREAGKEETRDRSGVKTGL